VKPERWQEIERLFTRATELPPEEQRAFLERSCSEQELRWRIENLLEADAVAGVFLETAVSAGARAFARDHPRDPSRLGKRRDRIGPYRLLEELGRGGMSSVHLAVRDDDVYSKRVAIKLVRRGMRTDDVLERFRGERQILATLDHPHIARLHDGGTTGDGVPYFVMEYVEGRPIDEYCDAHGLRLEERLELFRKVCSAVHYAHRNLVVHRDLKPSNVLVTGEGIPKLLDFGIAKLLDTDEESDVTATALRLLTPLYASPEQIRGGSITTASDVYSLGVLLYELLSGQRPHDLPPALPAVELDRLVSSREAERPSLVVGRGEDAAEVARARGISPAELERRLRGDLDNVVLMALRQEPERRYGSVEQFSEDLGRHLGGRPVIARPDTAGYRAAKFVRRHRWGVAAVSALVVLLFAFAGAMYVQSERIASERDRAAQVSEMVVALFEIAEPSGGRGDTITARELLDRGAEKVRELPDEPETAVLLDTLARLYQDLGLDARAVPLFERSLEIRRAAFGEIHTEVGDSLNRLARTLASKGDFTEAEPYFRRALEVRRELYGEDHPKVGIALNNLALIRHDLGHYSRAELLYRQALEIDRKHLGSKDPGTAITAGNLALLHLDRGEYAEAEELYREVLEIYRSHHGEESPEFARGLEDLGTAYLARGELELAEDAFRRTLAIREAHFGERHRAVARAFDRLGSALLAAGELEEAGRLLEKGLELRRELLGDDHAETAVSLESVANWRLASGQMAEAEALYRRAIEIYTATFSAEHPFLARPLLGLARVFEARGEPGRAEPLLRRALVLRQRELPASSPLIVEVENALSRLP